MTTPVIACRGFNTITVDRTSMTLFKSSRERQRLRDEHDWYVELPDGLRDLVPCVRGWVDDGETAELALELVQHASLANLYLDDSLDMAGWQIVLDDVLDVHARLRAHRMPVTSADAVAMYVDKTLNRIRQLAISGNGWPALLARRTITINGHRLRGLWMLRRDLEHRGSTLASSVNGSLIHGDFCLSNILYDADQRMVRLVDPRGRFGRKGAAGDPRYDIAKLRHSLGGGYDLVTADRFQLGGEGDEFAVDLHRSNTGSAVAGMFDNLILDCGYDPDDTRFIEALLFLSMPPLHADAPRRQLAMFLIGLTLLNEVLT